MEVVARHNLDNPLIDRATRDTWVDIFIDREKINRKLYARRSHSRGINQGTEGTSKT